MHLELDMEKADLYKSMYEEHAAQARKHEEQRERITALVLSIVTLLVGFITFAKLSMASSAASLLIVLLGIYGYFFAGKHYERFKLHTKIMRAMRRELDALTLNEGHVGKSVALLRDEAEAAHYREFVWPRFLGGRSAAQNTATSWVARQRLHVFWEAIHLIVVLIGVGLTFGILAKGCSPDQPDITKIQIVRQETNPSAATPPSGNEQRAAKK